MLSVPPSANSIWRSYRGRVIKSAKYCSWLRNCLIQIGRVGQVPGPLEVKIKAVMGKGWRKNRDLDNLIKPLMDLLKHSQIIIDDNSTIVKKISIWSEQPLGSVDAKVIVTVLGVQE